MKLTIFYLTCIQVYVTLKCTKLLLQHNGLNLSQIVRTYFQVFIAFVFLKIYKLNLMWRQFNLVFLRLPQNLLIRFCLNFNLLKFFNVTNQVLVT